MLAITLGSIAPRLRAISNRPLLARAMYIARQAAPQHRTGMSGRMRRTSAVVRSTANPATRNGTTRPERYASGSSTPATRVEEVTARRHKDSRYVSRRGGPDQAAGSYDGDVKRTSDRWFWTMLAIALAPVAAVAFALTRAAQDIGIAASDAPAPVAGFCRQTVVYTLDPFAHAAYGMFAAAAIVALSLGVAAGVASHLRTRRALRGYRTRAAVPTRLAQLATAAAIDRVRLIDSAHPLAFAFGYLRPSVAVSTALVRVLDDRELFAVLLHECEHVRRRDPLRVLVVAVVSRSLPFAPLIASLAELFKAAKEIDADQAVIRAMGSRDALVSALLSAGVAEPLGAAAGFADALSARIAALEGEEPANMGRGWRATAGTALTVLTLAAGVFVIATGAVDAHALHVCG